MVVDLDVDPVYRKRLLDPRGRPVDALLPVIADFHDEVEVTDERAAEPPPAPVTAADRRRGSTATPRSTRRWCSARATTS